MGGGISEKSNLNIGKKSKFFNWGGISEKSNLNIGKKSKFFNFGGRGVFRKSQIRTEQKISVFQLGGGVIWS